MRPAFCIVVSPEADMSARDRDLDQEPEITAQPKSISDELGMQSSHEQGLSVDPEDIGRTWLADATEQGNFESARGGENDELWASSSANGDEALPGPNFEVDHDVWENTVNLTLQNGESAASDPLIEGEEGDDDGLHLIEGEGAEEVDLTEPVIHEASLLDHEAAEFGETESPNPRTDDSKTHAQKRGGHAPKARSSASRAR
jgi:hypothetical protein